MFPKSLDEGLKSLLEQCRAEEIAMVRVTSISNPEYVDLLVKKLEKNGLSMPEARIFEYTPPYYAGYSVYGLITGASLRKESVPEIREQDLTYVITDDSFSSGCTFECAVRMLVNQGIRRERIFFLVLHIDDYKGNNEGPFLDTAHAFLSYKEEHVTIRPHYESFMGWLQAEMESRRIDKLIKPRSS